MRSEPDRRPEVVARVLTIGSICQTSATMARLASSFLLAGALLVVFAMPAVARVKPDDAAATLTYLKAQYIATRAADADIPAGFAALEALGKKLNVECPGVLANAPHLAPGESPSQSQLEITEEVLTVVLGTFERTDHPALAHFSHVVSGLRWSDRALTRLARSYAAERAAQSSLQAPDLCADLKAWVASGYQAVSPSTKQYVHRLDVISGMTVVNFNEGLDIGKIIARRLSPYEGRTDKAIVRRINRTEAQVKRRFKAELMAASKKATQVLSSAPSQ